MAKKTKCGLDLPRGVHENGSKLLIEFVFRGVRCRETLINLEVTKANIKLAERKRQRILDEIENNQFNYAFHFPSSRNLEKFRLIPKEIIFGNLLRDLIDSYERQYLSGNKSIATYKSYQHIIETHLIPTFGYYQIQDISAALIRDWITNLGLTAKRINTILIPLRLVFDNAINNELITESPLDKIAIKALLAEVANKSEYEIDPFTDEEKSKIIDYADGSVKNFIQFGFWTGMRLSEIIGLRWDNVDFNKGVINVTEAKVLGTIKTPKTKSGIRKVKILTPAMEALLNQKQINTKCEYVFTNPHTNREYANNNVFRRLWVDILAKARIKYRNPHQMRHTYASTLLLKGNKPLLVAQQLGHKNLSMLLQVYGKYIEDKEDEIII